MPVGRQVVQGRPLRATGQRDRNVTIEQTSGTIAGGGFPVVTWSTLGTAWMSRKDITADERFTAGQESAHASTIWVMAYQANMDPELIEVPKTRRLSYAGRKYDITTASILGRKDAIELLTLSKVG